MRFKRYSVPKVPFWVFILIAILYFSAIGVDTMDIDASQYAEISREMMKSGDYLHVFDRGMEYLDKPPLLFWVSAASMKVFGVNNFGYKFPSLLFALWALFATYRLTKLLYGEVTGRMAALILATCQGMFLMTNDIRCDTILMSWVITSIWFIKEWYVKQRLGYLLAAFASVAFGMMTKGPIALMVPIFCFSADWSLKRLWKNFIKPQYLLGLLVIVILLIPMSIGLYQQFDMHPEKMVNGQRGISGLRFFYWSQSFGRITGESPWKNAVYPTFLLENMLWSYLPWIILFLPAMLVNFLKLLANRFRLSAGPGNEWISTGGFLLTYYVLASSAYQLPHYIFVAFPLASIVTARFIYELVEEQKYQVFYKVAKPLFLVISCGLIMASLALITYVFPAHPLMIGAWFVGFGIWLYLAIKKDLKGKILWLPVTAMIVANVFVSNHLYPSLLQYQLGSSIGRYIYNSSIPPDDIAKYEVDDPVNSINFYAHGSIRNCPAMDSIRNQKYIITMDKGLNEIKATNHAFDILKEGRLYKVSELTPDFLKPNTRLAATKKYYFLKFRD